MPVFEENPDQFSKSRLKTELIAHNITLPSTESKKEVYLELYLKHISHKSAGDFSSDEEDDQVRDVAEEKTEAPEMFDLRGLTDDELKATLLKHGVKAGPIVATTRALYERKLKKIMEPASQPDLNGRGDVGRYSDSDEDDEQAEEDNVDGDFGLEQAKPEPVSQLDQDQQEISQDWLHTQNDGEYFYPQCFMPSPRLWARKGPGHRGTNPWRNAGNAMASSDLSDPHLLIHSVPSRTSSVGQHTESGVHRHQPVSLVGKHSCLPSSSQTFSITQMLESRSSLSPNTGMGRVRSGRDLQEPKSKAYMDPLPMVDKFTMTNRSLNVTTTVSPYELQSKEQVADVLKTMFPNTVTPPTGIRQVPSPDRQRATRRRPIKGAAERPIKFKYPDTPLSPATLESQLVERRLVPLWVRILVFLVVACLLYLIYASMEASLDSPFLSAIENQNVGSESEEGLPLLPESQDTPGSLSEQD